jgi:hypothetical protein
VPFIISIIHCHSNLETQRLRETKHKSTVAGIICVWNCVIIFLQSKLWVNGSTRRRGKQPSPCSPEKISCISRPGYRVSIPGRGESIFPVVSLCRLALGPTQLPVQWVPGGPFPGAKARPGCNAYHSPHLVPRSKMSRSYTSSPPWRLRSV